ncbi:hypothetical protein Ocin01_17701, partial [Orchesella cincta]
SLVIVFLLQLVSSRSSQPRYYTSTDSDGVERVVELIPSSVTLFQLYVNPMKEDQRQPAFQDL